MLNSKNLFIAIAVALLFVASYTFAQNNNGTEKYSQVRIYATSDNDFVKMGNAGLFLDGGIHKKGLYFETWLSESEISMLKNSGVSYQITINDWMEYYNSIPNMTAMEIQSALKKSKDEFDVSHSIYGTMGGHLKVAEINAKLDSLRLQYPTLV
ncbi:MAG: hypothetical protein WC358_08190, partial [Ignavibacteria bacterium]